MTDNKPIIIDPDVLRDWLTRYGFIIRIYAGDDASDHRFILSEAASNKLVADLQGLSENPPKPVPPCCQNCKHYSPYNDPTEGICAVEFNMCGCNNTIEDTEAVGCQWYDPKRRYQ